MHAGLSCWLPPAHQLTVKKTTDKVNTVTWHVIWDAVHFDQLKQCCMALQCQLNIADCVKQISDISASETVYMSLPRPRTECSD
jgi:hypothetical protein